MARADAARSSTITKPLLTSADYQLGAVDGAHHYAEHMTTPGRGRVMISDCHADVDIGTVDVARWTGLAANLEESATAFALLDRQVDSRADATRGISQRVLQRTPRRL
jgi:hypothetical protein